MRTACKYRARYASHADARLGPIEVHFRDPFHTLLRCPSARFMRASRTTTPHHRRWSIVSDAVCCQISASASAPPLLHLHVFLFPGSATTCQDCGTDEEDTTRLAYCRARHCSRVVVLCQAGEPFVTHCKLESARSLSVPVHRAVFLQHAATGTSDGTRYLTWAASSAK